MLSDGSLRGAISMCLLFFFVTKGGSGTTKGWGIAYKLFFIFTPIIVAECIKEEKGRFPVVNRILEN
tara:strand:+ start:313 stop:513 length:201 start_codon:yes stop_codon:yes gene_type:complete